MNDHFLLLTISLYNSDGEHFSTAYKHQAPSSDLKTGKNHSVTGFNLHTK
jgi:hypothetical protein